MNEESEGPRPGGDAGPFDKLLHPEPRRVGRGGMVGIAIAVLAVLILALVLPPISILSGGGGSSEGSVNVKTTARKDMPSLPEGLEAVSPLFDVSVSGSVKGPTVITLQLPSAVTDGRGLSLYTNDGGEWRRLGTGALVLDGSAVQGEVPQLPKNVAVLRRAASARQLMGSLPSGAELSPEAGRALSVLNPVDFAPAADGSLSGEAGAPQAPAGLVVRPTVRVSTQQDADAANRVMASPDLRSEQMNAILKMVEDGHFDGVDLDYGALDPLRKDDFSEFVANLAEQIHRRNLKLTLTAPLPVQQGTAWDTGAYDWTRLSQAADFIKVVPEQDPSRYYKRTEQALTFLIDDRKIAPAKLVLVVSALGREKGGEGIRALTALEALSLASTLTAKNGTEVRPGQSVVISGENVDTGGGASGIGWDDGALAVSFTYPGLGGARTVWIENVFSVGLRLDLAARYHLGGVAVDDVSTAAGAADIWPVVQEFIDSGNVSLVKPNGTLFVPHWEADGGSLQGGDDGSVTWTAPADPGTYTVTLVVSDGIARVGQRLRLTVKP